MTISSFVLLMYPIGAAMSLQAATVALTSSSENRPTGSFSPWRFFFGGIAMAGVALLLDSLGIANGGAHAVIFWSGFLIWTAGIERSLDRAADERSQSRKEMEGDESEDGAIEAPLEVSP